MLNRGPGAIAAFQSGVFFLVMGLFIIGFWGLFTPSGVGEFKGEHLLDHNDKVRANAYFLAHRSGFFTPGMAQDDVLSLIGQTWDCAEWYLEQRPEADTCLYPDIFDAGMRVMQFYFSDGELIGTRLGAT